MSNATLPGRQEPPLSETLAELWENISKLLRQEMALARAELSDKAQHLKGELLGSAAGAALMHAALLALVAAVVLLLATIMPAWLAAALTGCVAAAGGYLLLARKRPSIEELKPERTVQNLRQDMQTIKEAGK